MRKFTTHDGRTAMCCLEEERVSKFHRQLSDKQLSVPCGPESEVTVSLSTFRKCHTIRRFKCSDDEFIPEEVRETPRDKLQS